MSKLVAIVGRPNVGKSTLFNRLTGTRQAIVSDEAGTTRDRQYGKCEWGKREFSLVDTGGWVVNSDDIFEEEIRKQVILATQEADVILFLVDVKNGETDLDLQVAKILRQTKVPVILCANKTDNNEDRYNSAEFYSLGLGEHSASRLQREAERAIFWTKFSIKWAQKTMVTMRTTAFRVSLSLGVQMSERAASSMPLLGKTAISSQTLPAQRATAS